MIPLVLIVLGLATRFFDFGYPSQVVFDEVHSGNFISNYWHGTYFFDVHPPLAKLILLLFSHIVGAVPNVDFSTIGNALPHSYILMRILPSLLGSLIPVIIYFISRRIGFSKIVSSIAGLFVVFENSLVLQSRFVLFDTFLLFFGFTSLLVYMIYAQGVHKHSRKLSFLFIVLSAILASAAFGTKWTGLSFALIIICLEFVRIFMHNKISFSVFRKNCSRKNWSEYILFKTIFIFVFLILYISSFVIHFSLLPRSGPGDNYMSERFQNSLSGSKLPKPFAFVDGKLTQTNKMNSMEKTLELNKVMIEANVNFGSTHPYSSKWYTWPLMLRSIYYWNSTSHYIYLIGNPFIYWAGIVSVLFLFLSFVFEFCKNIFSKKNPSEDYVNFPTIFILLGFLANFLPFSFIGRVMFLYHYEPALIFSIMALAYLLNIMRNKKYFYPVIFVVIIVTILLFLYFSPLTYGYNLNDSELFSRMWLPGWR
jgi:dolichyl-phosphate-mannose-protein mannosyltransferase